MDFLLECIGLPPGYDQDELAQAIRERGETVPWRGRDGGVHLRYPFGGGLEVRLDQADDEERPTLWPHFTTSRRLRVAVRSLTRPAGATFGALLEGLANPPPGPLGPDDPHGELAGGDWPVCAWLSDARRLPRDLPRDHVLAVSLAGFALDVAYLGPNEGVRDAYILEEPQGASLLPVAGPDAPEGCMELSLRIRTLRHLENPLTREPIEALEVDAPGRPLELFCSRWQLDSQGLPAPRPGTRIEGAFLFTGRVAGGIPVR